MTTRTKTHARIRIALKFLAAIAVLLSSFFGVGAAAHAVSVDPNVIDIQGAGLDKMVLSPDGKTLAITSWGSGKPGQVFLLDIASSTISEVTSLGLSGSDQVGGSVFSPDGKTLYVTVWKGTDAEGAVLQLDLEVSTTAPTEGRLQVTQVTTLTNTEFTDLWSIGITPDGTTLLISRYEGGLVYFDIASKVASFVPAEQTTAVNNQFMSPDGSLVYLLGYNGAVDAYRATSDTTQQGLVAGSSWVPSDASGALPSGDFNVESSCLSPDGVFVFMPAGYDRDAVYKIKLSTGLVVDKGLYATPGAQNIGQWGCVVSPDGTSLFVTQPNDIDPAIVVQYSTADLSLEPIVHQLPYTPGAENNFAYSYEIAVVGCDAYISGYYSQIAILREIGCASDNTDSSGASVRQQLAATGSHSQSWSTVWFGTVAALLILSGVIAAGTFTVTRNR